MNSRDGSRITKKKKPEHDRVISQFTSSNKAPKRSSSHRKSCFYLISDGVFPPEQRYGEPWLIPGFSMLFTSAPHSCAALKSDPGLFLFLSRKLEQADTEPAHFLSPTIPQAVCRLCKHTFPPLLSSRACPLTVRQQWACSHRIGTHGDTETPTAHKLTSSPTVRRRARCLHVRLVYFPVTGQEQSRVVVGLVHVHYRVIVCYCTTRVSG